MESDWGWPVLSAQAEPLFSGRSEGEAEEAVRDTGQLSSRLVGK